MKRTVLTFSTKLHHSYHRSRLSTTFTAFKFSIIFSAFISCFFLLLPKSLEAGWPIFDLSNPNLYDEAYQLVWWDDFDGDSLDLKKWYHLIDCSGRGNNELQCYTNRSDNVLVQEGLLKLFAKPEKYQGRDYTSGRIHAAGQGWTFGFFEARARLPKGKHLWPAIWMVPASGVYGPWPSSGEIDIMESRGQRVFSMESTIHFGASRSDRSKIGTKMLDFPFDFSQDFHVFGFEWTNRSMTWYLDGIRYFEIPTDRWFITDKGTRMYNHSGAPFDQSFKWILNVAVGGGYFPKDTYGDISWEEAIKWEKPFMEVDWVRVFKKMPISTVYVDHEATSATTESSTIDYSSLLPTTTTTSSTIYESNFQSSKKDEDKKIKEEKPAETVDGKKDNEVVFYEYETISSSEEPSIADYYDTL